MQGLLVLTVGKFNICRPAVALDGGKRIKLSQGVAVGKTSKMAPVDLHLLAGAGLKPDKWGTKLLLPSQFFQIIPDDGDFSIKTLFSDSLKHHRGSDFGILFKKRFDPISIGIEL